MIQNLEQYAKVDACMCLIHRPISPSGASLMHPLKVVLICCMCPAVQNLKLHRTTVHTVDIKATRSAICCWTMPPLLLNPLLSHHYYLQNDAPLICMRTHAYYIYCYDPVVQICHDWYALLEKNLWDTQ